MTTKMMTMVLMFATANLFAQSTLYVKNKSGTQTSFALSSIKKLTFAAGNMTVTKTDASTQNFALSSNRYLSFKDIGTGVLTMENTESSTLTVFPNPASNFLQINSAEDISGRQVQIINLQGQVVLQTVLQSQTTSVNITGLQTGIYLCRVQNQKQVNTIKFIKN